MKDLEDPIKNRFEDIEDMMDHAHEQIINAVYHFCLCTKLNLPFADPKVIKSLLMTFVEEEFDDMDERLIPYVEKNGNETIVYGLLRKE